MATQKKGRPLKGKRVLITRPQQQAQPFVALLKKHGAVPIVFPTIRIVPPRTWEEIDNALEILAEYDTLIFTSVNGVHYFFDRLGQLGMSPEPLASRTICAIGPSTAARLKRFGVEVSLVPSRFQAESILDTLEEQGIEGKRFLLPRAERARDILPTEIRKRGGSIDVVTAYRTAKATADSEELRKLLENHDIDVISFTSSSTVEHFVELLSFQDLGKLTEGCVIACIGPITADTALSYGLEPHVVAKEYTIEGLTKAMGRYFRRTDGG